MSVVVITSEKNNDPVVDLYQLSTESKTLDGGDEESRAVLRVVISQEALNVTDVSQPVDTLESELSLTARFNQSTSVQILPLKDAFDDTYPFKLVDQSYTPYESKGSRMFRGTKEWVSVTPWVSLTWAS